MRIGNKHLGGGPDRRWNAVVRRLAEADGTFVYGVKTTKIFCRPQCRSRLPRREHVEFFDTPGQALHAGFRPCKRCQPDGIDSDREVDSRIAAACRLLETSHEVVSLRKLAQAARFSLFHFHRLFTERLGCTPRQYQEARRLGRLKSRLRHSATVTAAIYDAGFGSAGRAYDGVARKLGMRPAQYRKGGAGLEIRFGLQETNFGPALIAVTEHGVCAIDFAASAERLRRRLVDEFPCAVVREHPASVAQHFSALTDYLVQPAHGFSLPLDVQGTALQCRVWRALRDVPAGQTVTYSELARRTGTPNAVRAVASACAANKVALAVPCHRAIRSDGGLGGYRWGLERKRKLLRREAETIVAGHRR